MDRFLVIFCWTIYKMVYHSSFGPFPSAVVQRCTYYFALLLVCFLPPRRFFFSLLCHYYGLDLREMTKCENNILIINIIIIIIVINIIVTIIIINIIIILNINTIINTIITSSQSQPHPHHRHLHQYHISSLVSSQS